MERLIMERHIKSILEHINELDNADGTDVLNIIESAYVNQVAGAIIADNPGGDEDLRFKQLVTILADFLICMRNRFLTDAQVMRIKSGEKLEKVVLFSEVLESIQYDDFLKIAIPPTPHDN